MGHHDHAGPRGRLFLTEGMEPYNTEGVRVTYAPKPEKPKAEPITMPPTIVPEATPAAIAEHYGLAPNEATLILLARGRITEKDLKTDKLWIAVQKKRMHGNDPKLAAHLWGAGKYFRTDYKELPIKEALDLYLSGQLHSNYNMPSDVWQSAIASGKLDVFGRH